MFFTIVVPSFNSKIIDRTISSLKKQTFNDWECIIVDDNSTDDTINRIRSEINGFNKFVLIERDRFPKGAQTCRNIGANLAKGEFLVFLDSDDEFNETTLMRRSKEIIKDDNYDFHVFPHSVCVNNAIIENVIPKDCLYLEEFLSSTFPWHTMSVVWKKQSFYFSNGFLEGLPRLNDPELMIRSMQLGLHYKVYHGYNSDCIYYPGEHDLFQFSNRMVDTYKMFLPSISKGLNLHQKKLVRSYLKNWFFDIYFPLGSSRIGKSLKVIFFFRKSRIISFCSLFSLFFLMTLYSISSMLNKVIKRVIIKVI